METVQHITRVLEREQSAKLETEVKLSFNSLYARDLAGRAMVFNKLVQGGMAVAMAAALTGLVERD